MICSSLFCEIWRINNMRNFGFYYHVGLWQIADFWSSGLRGLFFLENKFGVGGDIFAWQ
jgi:hypothetical protein